MRCYKCNSLLDDNDYCLKCGADVSVYKIVVRASNSYYNQGLQKAQVRDLTGAVTALRTSLSINKNNVKARNLLGLVYFELGEVVMALSEWVISKNIKPERNVADVYIRKVQANPNKLEAMNQAIKKYNISLQHAKDGSYDMAVIQLKKVIILNPRLTKAALLLGLLYMKEGQKDRAEKVLKKVQKIDRNNTLALRYLDEINGVGMADIQEEGDGILPGRKKKHFAREEMTGHDVIIPPNSYKEPSNGVFTVLSILLGVIIGAAMVWYLIVPSKLSNINYDNNREMLKYNEQLAANAVDIANLQSQISTLETERDNLEHQLSNYTGDTGESMMYSMLIDSANAYINNDFAQALVLLQNIDIALLPTQTAKDVYSTMLEYCVGGADRFQIAGTRSYMEGDYVSAISYLSAASVYDETNEEVAYYLGLSYEAAEDVVNAAASYEAFLENFPQSEHTADVTARLAALVIPEDTEEQSEEEITVSENVSEEETSEEETTQVIPE